MQETYYYDDNSQLVRDDSVTQNETIVYAYDINGNGNLTSKTVYPYTTASKLSSVTPTHTYNYQYGDSADSDRLESYDGDMISYDTDGNATGYDGWTYTWENGHFKTASRTGDSIFYDYNSDGIRIKKIVNNVETDYTLDGDRVAGENNGTDNIAYTYDSNGKPYSMKLNGVNYLYELNNQGDVIGLVDNANQEVVTYTYDAWGKLLSTGGSLAATVGAKNPLRYRGYYFDTETGLYYLQSRYYNPEWGRFISKDDQSYHDGESGAAANLYAYADNNPVMKSDPSGHWVTRAIIAAVSGAIFGTIAYLIGKALRLNKRGLTIFTASFVCVGIVIGAIWGPSIIYKINKFMKPVIYFFSHPGKVYFGIKILGRIQFELHNPHHGKWIHFVIRILKDGRLREYKEFIFRRL